MKISFPKEEYSWRGFTGERGLFLLFCFLDGNIITQTAWKLGLMKLDLSKFTNSQHAHMWPTIAALLGSSQGEGQEPQQNKKVTWTSKFETAFEKNYVAHHQKPSGQWLLNCSESKGNTKRRAPFQDSDWD